MGTSWWFDIRMHYESIRPPPLFYCLWYEVRVEVFQVDITVFTATVVEKTIFSPLDYWDNFAKLNWMYIWSLLLNTILFHWFICLYILFWFHFSSFWYIFFVILGIHGTFRNGHRIFVNFSDIFCYCYLL